MPRTSSDGLRDWRDTFRRGGRATRLRVGRAVARRLAIARGGAGEQPIPVRTYWWDVEANFGDQLNVDVLMHLGYAPRWTSANSSELLPIGSLLEHVTDDYRGVVWGTGMMVDQQRELSEASIVAVRGALTWKNLGGAEGVVLGDPGLLCESVYGPVPRHGKIALVPHYRQVNDVFRAIANRSQHEYVLVDATQPPSEVVHAIAGARAVVSTSLHGLIVADSYGVPAAWWHPARLHAGGEFKFRDYETIFNDVPSREIRLRDDMTPSDIDTCCFPAPNRDVMRVCDELVQALHREFHPPAGHRSWEAGSGN